VSVTPSVSITPSVTPSKSITPSTSALNLTLVKLFPPGASLVSACSPVGSLVNHWHDGSGQPSPGDRIYNNSTGTVTTAAGYYQNGASGLGGYNDLVTLNSSGYVTSIQNCADNCVIEGTSISISISETTPVQNLEIGNTVYSKHIETLVDSDDPVTLTQWHSSNIDGNPSTATVTNNPSTISPFVWNFNNGLIKTTAGHLHIVKRGVEWLIQKATNVQIGDYFENINGDLVEITSITQEEYNGNVYKLNVEDDDVYYANGILTHNIK